MQGVIFEKLGTINRLFAGFSLKNPKSQQFLLRYISLFYNSYDFRQ